MSSTAPTPFIQLRGSKLVVTEEAKRALTSLKGTVGVCAVAGVYRTGKSFILNQLAGKSSGFSVGGTVQAHTKGIWMWGAPLQLSAPGAPDNLLLLDTEGLQSLSATEGHDAKIFSLAILLASSFLYNSEKAINNAAIDQLSLVAQLTQRIRAKSGRGDESAAALASEMPDFLWLLRDFQLELADEAGQPISTDQYLESCLLPQPGSSAATKEQNQTRSAIQKLFRERSCIALPHPTLGTALPPSALKDLPPLDKLSSLSCTGCCTRPNEAGA